MGSINVRYLIERSYKGKTRYYWSPKKQYVLNGMPTKCPYPITRLKGDILAHAARLNDMLDTWLATSEPEVKYVHGTVGWLIVEYKRDPRFTELRQSTKNLYECMLPQIRDELGDIPCNGVSRQAARNFCLSFGEYSRKPSAMAALCRLIFNFGKAIDAVQQNPFDGLRIPKPKPRRTIWSDEQIAAVQAKAIELGHPSIALAVQLGIDTAQRPSDLRALAWNQYDGQWLKLKQNKTGTLVDVPVMHMPKLKSMLDKAMETRESTIILVYEATGKPYTKEMLASTFREICRKAAIPDEYEFRDFRRTFMVRGAENGLTGEELSSISGHQLDTSHKILEVYIPRTRVMAENAAIKREKKDG